MPACWIAEPLAGARHAALHFVADQQPAQFVAQLAQAFLELKRREVDAALALNDLQHHGDNILVVFGDHPDRVEVVIRHADETRNQRLEAGLRLAVAGGRKRRHRPPMERFFHDDDGWRVDALLVTVITRQLDCRLVGFTAGVAEENLLHPGEFGQPVGQLFLFADAVKVRGMQQAPGLRRNRRDQPGMAVTERQHGNPGQRIQILLALGIGNPASLTMTEGHGQPGVGIHHMRHEPTPKNENGGQCRRNHRDPNDRTPSERAAER